MPVRQGPAALLPPAGVDTSMFVEPVSWYDYYQGFTVIGGYVYRGPNEPRMNGIYFLGDFIGTFGFPIWGLKQRGTNWQRFELAKTRLPVSTFGEDERGRLFLADYSRFIYR